MGLEVRFFLLMLATQYLFRCFAKSVGQCAADDFISCHQGLNVGCFSSRREPAARHQLFFQYNRVNNFAGIILERPATSLLLW